MGSELGRKEDCMKLLKTLGRDDVLEVFSQGLCHCDAAMLTRIQNLAKRKLQDMSDSSNNATTMSRELQSTDAKSTPRGYKKSSDSVSRRRIDGHGPNKSSISANRTQSAFRHAGSNKSMPDFWLSEDQELIRFQQVRRDEDFCLIQRINRKPKNLLKGLELQTGVFNSEEQKKIVDCVLQLQVKGQNGQLRGRTYSEPRKWMRGKGRVTIQFGCCYNYALDSNGNPPGIIRNEEVDPLPPLFKEMIRRMIRWHILPPDCVPDSCIVNIYEEGDCIPPHIDHHDFVRPFCTVSLLSECNILFGTNLQVLSAGEFDGPFSMILPLGSVLVLNGSAADVVKHCVPSVQYKRISITFRKMDPRKVPYKHVLDHELSGIKPLEFSPSRKLQLDQNSSETTILDESRVIPEATYGCKANFREGNNGPASKKNYF